MGTNFVDVKLFDKNRVNVKLPQKAKHQSVSIGLSDKTTIIQNLNVKKISELVNDVGYITMEDLENVIQDFGMINMKSFEDWSDNAGYIPKYGEIIVITDIGDDKSLTISIGDGETSIFDLKSISSETKKLNHSLTIGDKVFDGSKDVVIGVYDGEIIEETRLFNASQEIPVQNMENVGTRMVMTDTSNTATMTMTDTVNKMTLAIS